MSKRETLRAIFSDAIWLLSCPEVVSSYYYLKWGAPGKGWGEQMSVHFPKEILASNLWVLLLASKSFCMFQIAGTLEEGTNLGFSFVPLWKPSWGSQGLHWKPLSSCPSGLGHSGLEFDLWFTYLSSQGRMCNHQDSLSSWTSHLQSQHSGDRSRRSIATQDHLGLHKF